LYGFKMIWHINYSLVFVSILAAVNLGKLKNTALGFLNLALIGVSVFWFLTQGLLELSELRENYLDQSLHILYTPSIFYLAFRYVSFVFLAMSLFAAYRYLKQPEYAIGKLKTVFNVYVYVTILWVASSELIHLLDLAGSHSQYKLGLSILWGIYSLILIVIGLWKQKKLIRVSAIVLFGITLVKLFFYDLASLSTISKTIVLVSLGILLLIISFLYNKYKSRVTNDVSD